MAIKALRGDPGEELVHWMLMDLYALLMILGVFIGVIFAIIMDKVEQPKESSKTLILDVDALKGNLEISGQNYKSAIEQLGYALDQSRVCFNSTEVQNAIEYSDYKLKAKYFTDIKSTSNIDNGISTGFIVSRMYFGSIELKGAPYCDEGLIKLDIYLLQKNRGKREWVAFPFARAYIMSEDNYHWTYNLVDSEMNPLYDQFIKDLNAKRVENED